MFRIVLCCVLVVHDPDSAKGPNGFMPCDAGPSDFTKYLQAHRRRTHRSMAQRIESFMLVIEIFKQRVSSKICNY